MRNSVTKSIRPRSIPWVILAAFFCAAGIGSVSAATLEEVVVTAQKRQESLQDVSLSVNVVTGKSIADMGLANFDALEVPVISGQQDGSMFDTGACDQGIGHPHRSSL